MGNIGFAYDTLASLDSSLTVNAGATTAGSSRDLGTSNPTPALIAAQFSITNSGSTDGYDLDIRVQFSDDDTNWPDSGHGLPIDNLFHATAGQDLTRSRVYSFTPLLRYFRFEYTNNNSTDNLSVGSETAEHHYNAA